MTNAPVFRRETLVAVDAVTRALELARGGVGASDISAKEGRDLVTAADVAVEDLVRATLAEAFPFPAVGEERGGKPPIDGSPYWLVDPICGTRNFASRIPLYCVNLALVESDQVTVAVVADASRNEIDVAELGRGAWTLSEGSSHRLATSDASRTLVIETGKSKGQRRERAARFAAAAIRADRWDFRSLGTTLSSLYVAAGRLAGYVVFTVTAVHAAAGALLVAEAGGIVSDIDGHPWSIASDSLVATATRDLHDDLLVLARNNA
jgi:myo-inositol-1(or 4)-monophosphatase